MGATLHEWKETRYRGRLDAFEPPKKEKEDFDLPYAAK
jgi:hypothetical protein